jgi:hypothetical protein
MVSVLWCPSAPQLSQDVSTTAGFVCDKAAVFGDVIKGTFFVFFNANKWRL